MRHMFETLLAALIRRQGQTDVHYVTPVQPAAADGLLAETYDQIENEFLVAPPFTLHSPAPRLFAAAWSVFRESLVVGDVPRPVKEAIATGVSRSNRCPYCVDAHGMSVQAGAGRDVAVAVERGDYDAVDDPQIREAARWGEATRDPEADVVADPPYTRQQAPEYVGTALTFHYVNRMVNVFCEDSPFPLPSALDGLSGMMRRFAVPTIRSAVQRSPEPGRSLDLLPWSESVDVPPWAESNPTIGRAFAGFSAIADELAGEHFTEPALDVVRDQIERWDGGDHEIGGGELSVPDESLTDADRVVAELGLTTALASYRVDDDLVDRFHREYPSDEALVVLTSWASLRAARRIGAWLVVPGE